MGYPNKRVSMTDVHGEPQQGGYLPAEIWHAYMAAVTEGQPCSDLPDSKEAISYQPFYGNYATTGEAEASKAHEEAAPTTPRKHRAQAQRRAVPKTPNRRPHPGGHNENSPPQHRNAARRRGQRRRPSTKPAARRRPGLSAVTPRPSSAAALVV